MDNSDKGLVSAGQDRGVAADAARLSPSVEPVPVSPIIPFTQYLRPNGRRREVCIEVAPAIAAKAHAIIARGLAFECEELMTGQVSLTITDPEEGDLDIRVVPNGPGVREAVEDLISRFGTTD